MKFYVKDIPDQWPVFQYMASKTNLKAHILELRFKIRDLVNLKHTVDLDALKIDVLNILKLNEPKGWLTAGGRSKPYTGLSLVYNLNLQEDDSWETNEFFGKNTR